MKPYRLLFVCLGNICRSPAAEGIMKHVVEANGDSQRFVIDSAGIGGWHVGQLPDNRMRRHGAKHGYNFNSRARQFEPHDFNRFDLIVAMDDDNRRSLLHIASNDDDKNKIVMMTDFLTHHPDNNVVPDPYYGGDNGFELVIELLEDACNGLYHNIVSGKIL